MENPWDKLPDETPRAFSAFNDFLEMGHNRTLRGCSEQYGHSVSGVRKWAMLYDWTRRARAYTIWDLQKAAEGREEVREQARQVMIEAAVKASETLSSVQRGRLDMPECEDGCTEDRCMCGVWLPVMDRHGEVVGRKPVVAPSTRQSAAQAILDRSGMAPPKRMEITGADGERLRIEAQLALGTLKGDKLAALAEAFSDDD